jgi:transcriptional regulator with XRE-family HTH domain
MSARGLFFDREFTHEEERIDAREDLIYNVTEDILVLLDEISLSKNELATKMGKSKSFVTQVLKGSRNMTLGTLSDMCFALGATPKINIELTPPHKKELENSEVRWKEENVNLSRLKSIVKVENVYDCQDGKIWQNQAA